MAIALLSACGDTDNGLAPCDPFVDRCLEDERCAMVFEFDAGDEVTSAGFFCVMEGLVAEGGLCRGVSTGDDEAGRELVTDDCRSGLFCATLGNERRCRALCDGEAFGCGGLEFCQGLSMNPFFAVCTPADNCDVIGQDCPDGKGCYATTSGEGEVLSHCFDFIASPGGAGEVGSTCEFTGDCAPGSDCFDHSASSSGFTCQLFCDPEDSEGACPAGQVCTPISADADAQSVPGLCG